MNDSLISSNCSLQYPMSSQSGNIPDLAAYSGHPSSFILESEASEPNSSPRHGFVQHPAPLPSDMGLRYMTIPALDDVRFGPDSGTSTNSPVYSIESTIPTSTVNFSPFSNVFQPQLSGSTTYSNTSGYYSPNPSLYSMPDIKPRLGTINSSPGMAPPTRSPLPPPVSPVGTREIYTSATPQQLRRPSDIHSRSPSIPGTLRGVPLSPSSSGGFASPANMETSQLTNNSPPGPPFGATEELLQLQSTDGVLIRPEIYGKIDKGFFLAENDWTCYRRNYFSLNCSYALTPPASQGNPIHIMRASGPSTQLYNFAMSISAVVDGRDGKAIELVQHTPKRDKGPQGKPDRKILSARPPAATGHGYGSGDGSLPAGPSLFDQRFGQHPQLPPIEASFERIQFKQATANNGKRRAAQQYYHLLIELWADTGVQMGEENRWVRIAYRMSAPMVVRGRSPGHYHGDRRGSVSSAGPGGSGGHGGDAGGSSYTQGGGARGGGDSISMSGGSNMLTGNSYTGNYQDTRSHHYGNGSSGQGGNHVETPMEPIMSTEEGKAIDEYHGYQYFPSPLYEGHVSNTRAPGLASFSNSSYREDRGSGFHLPEVSAYTHGNGMPKIKQEYNSNSGLSLPSLTSGLGPPDMGRFFGRFEGASSSRGYYPVTMFPQSEVDTT